MIDINTSGSEECMKANLRQAITIICPNCGFDSGLGVDPYLKYELPYTYYSGTCKYCQRSFKQVAIHSADDVVGIEK